MTLENKLGKIVTVRRIQSPGFNYNQDYVDKLVRCGFKPTDAVYDVVIEFPSERKAVLMRIEQLTEVAREYNINRPGKLVGSKVKCDIVGTSAGFITAIRAVKSELDHQKLKGTAEGVAAMYEAQPPMVSSHGTVRVVYPIV